jgi:hypothetical protein
LSTLVSAALACGTLTAELEPTQDLTVVHRGETPRMEVAPTSTQPPPTVTLIPSAGAPPATEEPSLVPECPLPGSPGLDRPADVSGYGDSIQRYLSGGGDLGVLTSSLAEWGALPDAENQVVAADLTGDGVDEVVVALARPDAQALVRPGQLLIFGCSEGTYASLYREGDIIEEMFGPAIELTHLGDVNLDGRPDLVYVLRNCGAHTCSEALRILGWDGAQLVNLMGGTLELPYPTYVVEPGRIEAISGGIGSVGAEPQRGYAEIWAWNGDVFTRTETIYEPPVYRYHALLDGDRALLAGDYPTAAVAYGRVIGDDTLESFVGVISEANGADEHTFLTAFAHWRLLLTHLRMGETASAQGELDVLLADYAPGAAGHEVAQMASAFWDTYLREESIAQGCSEIVASAARYDAVLSFFNDNYGYANPWWEPDDLCPFTDLR